MKFERLWRLWGWRTRLGVSFLGVILLSLSLVAVGIELLAPARLDELGLFASRRRALRLAPFLADYYQQTGSWAGIDPLVERFNRPLLAPLIGPEETSRGFDILGSFPSYPQRPKLLEAVATDRLVLLNTGERVIVDSAALLAPGQALPVELRSYVVPIYNISPSPGKLLLISPLEQQLPAAVLTALERTLLSAGLLAGVLTLAVSLWLSQRLSQPLQQLDRAARQLAAGETSNLLPVDSEDEIGRLTQTFNEMAMALSQQKQLRQQLMADVAHELRTPLSIMQLEIEGLADGLQEPATAATSLQEEIRALNRLVEDLRLLSLADVGALHFSLTWLDPAPFLEGVVEVWQEPARQQQVELQAEIAMPLPSIYADAGRLAQVLHNLIGNALHYSPSGARITLGARAEDTEVWLWVADQGPGIAEEHLPYLFERFYRTDASRSRETGGSGLGLAIARQWITLHHGRLWVESKPGKGATFYVVLPGRGGSGGAERPGS